MKKVIGIIILCIIALGAVGCSNSEGAKSEEKEVAILENVEAFSLDAIDYASTPSQEDYPDANGIYLMDYSVIDETHSNQLAHFRREIKIMNNKGVKDYGEFRINYDSEEESIKLLDVKTINKDGKISKPDENAINDITPAQDSNASIYSNVKIKTISMPAVEPGSIVVCEYAIVNKNRLIKDEFWYSSLFQINDPILDIKVVLKAPLDKKVNYKMRNEDSMLEPKIVEKDEYKEFIWERKNIEKITTEPGMTSFRNTLPVLEITTLESWAQVGNWYQDYITNQYDVNDSIKTKITELTKDDSTKDEKIESIYNYITSNIRYIGMQFGESGYKPYSAIEIFENKYGVCKEKGTLLISMLRAIDVEAVPVLINRGSGKIDEEFITPSQFNHFIVYLPKEDLFLDPTSDGTMFGILPGDQGKLVLLPETNELVTTPIQASEVNRSNIDQVIKLKDDKKADIQFSLSAKGLQALSIKSLFKQLDKKQYELVLDQIFTESFSDYDLHDYEINGVEDLSEIFEISSNKITVNDYYETFENNIIIKPVKFPFYINQRTASEEIDFPVHIGYKESEVRTYVIEIPSDYKVKELPQNISFSNDIGSLTFDITEEESTLKMEISYACDKLEILPNEYLEAKELFNMTSKLVDTKIVLEKK
jgi:hypothetical protein